jgi:hypothetical protein
MDVLGMRAIRQSLTQTSQPPPNRETLYRTTLAGDLVANTLYYSLVGVGRPEGALWRGAMLGALAGLGGVLLPGPLGLGTAPAARTNATAIMTVAWYTLGGVAAALAYQAFAPESYG